MVGSGFNPQAARSCNQRDIACLPGCVAETEARTAEKAWAKTVSVCAGEPVGGPDFVLALMVPQFDATAVFEALVNAVAHRDYSMYGSKIRLRLFSNRLEIYVPGALANTMTLDSLDQRQSSRNETIASLLAKCAVPSAISGQETARSTFMDRRGEGVSIILDRSERLSGRRPVYELPDQSELKLTIFAASASSTGEAS